jgi:hypothetical protein
VKQKFDDLPLEDKQQVIRKVKAQGKIHLLKHNTEVEIVNGQLKVYLAVPLSFGGEEKSNVDN